MPFFRKKPVTIEAHQFWPDYPQWPKGVKEDPDSPTGYGIFTLEDTKRMHEVTPGDWIITGIAGERYPCKPDIFEKTYEPLSYSNPTMMGTRKEVVDAAEHENG